MGPVLSNVCVGRFNLGRLRPSYSSGRQTPLKSQCLSAKSETQTDTQSPDYLPLVGIIHFIHVLNLNFEVFHVTNNQSMLHLRLTSKFSN